MDIMVERMVENTNNIVDIYDNFFSENIRNEIYDFLIKEPIWSFNTGGTETDRIWHADNLEKNTYFNDFIFNIICEKLNRNFLVKRIYANGQTATMCGNPHQDDGDLTFLYYPNPFWDVKDQGHLVFLKSDTEVAGGGTRTEVDRIVTYKPNRALLFPGSIVHYSDAPHRKFNGLRISLAYKLESVDTDIKWRVNE